VKLYFTQTAVIDFEFEVTPGGLPDVLCMVAHVLDEHLNHMRTVTLWRGEFGDRPPFDTANTLIVGYSLWAELTCFTQLGWSLPTYVFDLHTAYLSVSNILAPYAPDEPRKKDRKRLSDACRAYDISGWGDVDKETIAKDIGEGRWRIYGRQRCTWYCNEDVRVEAELTRRMLSGWAKFRPVNAQLVMHWSNYSAKAVAQIQARGMPIDTHLWNMVQENKAVVISYLLRRFDPSYGSDYPIYTPDGHWSYAQFEAWLKSAGITAWPRLQSGELDISSKAFKANGHLPGIERLHALRDSLGVIVRARLPIGRDGRNRPSLFPFGTATGRNAHAKSLFNAHAGLRSFMVADGTLIYLDWRTQEVGIAAALSGDRALMDAYAQGDVYYALAKLCELTSDTDMVRWKRENQAQRQRMKSLQLAINYGMGIASLARGLGRHPIIAGAVIEKHKRQYSRFWEWRADRVRSAMIERQMDSVFGWPLHLSTSPNVRTLYNFPMQSNGAEMLRLAACRLCDAGLVPSMLIHDGVLLEVRSEEEIEHAKEIMRAAGREVCGGFEIGVDEDQRLLHGARYQDKRPVPKEMWQTIMEALRAVGALSERDAA
jgi:DNA polymerase I